MPCFSVRSISVDLSALGRIDAELLTRAFQALNLGGELYNEAGYIRINDGGCYRLATGTLDIRGGRSVTLDQVKQAYGAEVVKSTAKKYGWTLKEVAPFKYQVTKKSYG